MAAGTLAYGVRAPRSSMLAPSVYRGVPGRKAIALTFDDGPCESTPELLAILAEHRVKATFFQCGANVRRLPAAAREVAAAGHEIANHSDTHPMLYFRSPAFMRTELAAAQRSIEDTIGVRPKFFRAPYGVRWFGLGAIQRELALQGVMWTVLGLDWKLSADRIAERLLARGSSGAIACLHDGRQIAVNPDISQTLSAVRRVIPVWLEQGYKFETVSQILCPTN